MSEPSTIDDMIIVLSKLKTRLGGDTRVVFQDLYAGTLSSPQITIAATAKHNKNRIVSRGGIPCVLIF